MHIVYNFRQNVCQSAFTAAALNKVMNGLLRKEARKRTRAGVARIKLNFNQA